MKVIRRVALASIVVAGLTGCASERAASGSGAGGTYSNPAPACNTVGTFVSEANATNPGLPYCGQ